jgi:hypothetical protein
VASAAHRATTSAANVAVAPPKLTILSPKNGQQTGSAFTVSVRVSGAGGAAPRLLYVLDHGRARHGSTHLALHGLTPGAHHIEVSLEGDASVHATHRFRDRAPARAPAPITMPTTTSSSSEAPSPVHTSESPPPEEAPRRTTTQKPPREVSEHPSTTTTPPETGGIPQGGGGDGDSDNSGGPSDGDGNV